MQQLQEFNPHQLKAMVEVFQKEALQQEQQALQLKVQKNNSLKSNFLPNQKLGSFYFIKNVNLLKK